MTLQQIKYIIAVADEASISKAANKLYVSQPRISNAIHDMESELGFEIFERSSRGVTVTPKGYEFWDMPDRLYGKVIFWRSVIFQRERKSCSFRFLLTIICLLHVLLLNL